MEDGMALNAPVVNDVSDGCLATGEGTTEKNSWQAKWLNWVLRTREKCRLSS